MKIVEMFRKFNNCCAMDNDFLLVEYEPNILIGVDRLSNVCVITPSLDPQKLPLKYKTKNICIECNVKVCYTLDGVQQEGVVHIIRCTVLAQREKELFLELAAILIHESDGSEEALMETFHTLRAFFSEKKEVSDNELIGLYAELYSICKFHESLGMEKYWQSQDRMKFDFSFTDKVKLEIKATTRNSRTHHFRHEQLMTELYDIYVLSYMLRYDDEGLSLFALLQECKAYLLNDARKLLRINYYLKNVSEDRLKGIRFNSNYTEKNRHFYHAIDIPKFNQSTPKGVANAEYDCVMDNVSIIEDDVFATAISAIV